MREANLTVPLIESDRGSNQFSLTVLMHNLFDKQDIEWLKSFKDYNLSDEEARTLIVIREMGRLPMPIIEQLMPWIPNSKWPFTTAARSRPFRAKGRREYYLLRSHSKVIDRGDGLIGSPYNSVI